MRRREFITLLGGAAQDSRILQPASPILHWLLSRFAGADCRC